jgi:hypothetical protein
MNAPDLMALPAPPALFLVLFGLTFVVHMLFLGLLVAALWARVGAEWGKRNSYAIEPLHRAGVLAFSTTITAGVAPLLFVQVLFGKYFYTSSITIGFPWLAIIGYLMVGFYSLYLWRWRWEKTGGPSASGKAFVLLTILCVVAIGFTYAWNHLQSLSYTAWSQMVPHSQVGRRLMGYGGGTAIASGAWVLWLGHAWRSDRKTPRGASIALVVGGILSLGWASMSPFAIGDWGAAAWVILLFGAVLSLVAGIVGFLGRVGLARWPASLAAVSALTGLVIQRESYRLLMLSGDYNPSDMTVRAQWGAFAMFAIVLVLGIATLVWLFRVVRAAQRSTTSAH